jgi:hypothetical protein
MPSDTLLRKLWKQKNTVQNFEKHNRKINPHKTTKYRDEKEMEYNETKLIAERLVGMERIPGADVIKLGRFVTSREFGQCKQWQNQY